MAHMLASLRGVSPEEIKRTLQRDATHHAEQGFYLEHLWQNVKDADEVLFLFRVDDLAHAQDFIERVHQETREEDPTAVLPHMTFLEER